MIKQLAQVEGSVQAGLNEGLTIGNLAQRVPTFAQFPFAVVPQIVTLADFFIRNVRIAKVVNAPAQALLVEVQHKMVAVCFYASGILLEYVSD